MWVCGKGFNHQSYNHKSEDFFVIEDSKQNLYQSISSMSFYLSQYICQRHRNKTKTKQQLNLEIQLP